MKSVRIPAAAALQNPKTNAHSTWNHGKSSAERSERLQDASNRIYDGFARVNADYHGPKLKRSSPVFAMGSCFAREIERTLVQRGCSVISIDERIDRPEFKDSKGETRTGFLHRFTPFAMLQEFQQALGELPGWSERTLILDNGSHVIDLNYWDVDGSDMSLEGTLTRRRLAAELVRRSIEADVIILTLGLVESWLHKPTGLHANKVPAQTLIRNRDDFELHIISHEETIACLEGIRSLLKRHRTTPFQIVVTVSPVPLGKTFTSEDLIIANMTSKSTLRAAAADFCRRHPDTNYFPSYEMVTYSDPRLAWRPDRIHVEPMMVRHIVNTFTRAYYEEGEVRPESKKTALIEMPVGGEAAAKGAELNSSLIDQLSRTAQMLDAAFPD